MKVVGIGETLREGSTSLGTTAGRDLAGTNAIAAMVHAVHTLRGTVAPLMVAIPRVSKHADGGGEITDENYGARLEKLGRLVVKTAVRLRAAEDDPRAIKPAA